MTYGSSEDVEIAAVGACLPGLVILAWIVITTGCFFMICAGNLKFGLVIYSPLFLLTMVACFWLSGTDVVPFVDLPEQINYAGYTITKG
ncbi:hypothetical protein SAMN05660420_01429 [Desulfuromusa kysingii]|uniref:Uncharacterized protein n=1 Tax=Desulfuromusa kysingii TaxID=37625 RepID=A0A1H3YY29_9BACT|nr:hypothetical protein [Desulfuromusa kysingii]SEA16111.1 hypothetical protein SAMN05660420_01429 [Desulfuromusa kysingii]